jgi:hypothetical protein
MKRVYGSEKNKSKIERRFLLTAGLTGLLGNLLPADQASSERLDQGPFGIEQDQGWQTLLTTTPSQAHVRNYGLGLVGYTWEENGPALAVRHKKQSLEDAIEQMASLPFVDVLYIRCDWKQVQSAPGRLDLHPVWKLTEDAARRHGLRFAFRVQLSNPEIQPAQIALSDFLRDRVPLVNIGELDRHGRKVKLVEPRYDHPVFQKAFRELNELLAARFDNNPSVEWMDLMQYGFWGEGHTGNLPHPFPDASIAQQTLIEMAELQLKTWRQTPLAVNTQPDISKVGNDAVLKLAMDAGCWLRSDSIIVEEPIQVDRLANRPPSVPVIMEDGFLRQYDVEKIPLGPAQMNQRENAMLHVLDLGANYWALWTEAENLARYNARYPRGFETLQRRMGYRLRPGWIWQRKRAGRFEIIVAISNDGVAAPPGTLHLVLESRDRRLKLSGSLGPGDPLPGKIRLASFLLPAEITSGELHLRAELETHHVRRPLSWACAQPLASDGSIPITLKPANDKGWRKGV